MYKHLSSFCSHTCEDTLLFSCQMLFLYLPHSSITSFFMSSVIFISPHPSITSFFMSSDIFISPPPFYHSFFLSFLSCFVCLFCSIPRTCYTRKKVGTNIVFTGLSLMRRTMREWAESHFFSQHFFSPPARYRECKRNVIYGQKPIHHSHYFDMIFFYLYHSISFFAISPFEER